MQSDDPPFLPIGTEISAKFKGAFCEAKVKRVTKSVKCKLTNKEPPFATINCDDTAIKGSIEVGAVVEVALSNSKERVQAVVQHVKDCSTYVVVFDDGDERTLRRTQIVLKSAKHFDAAGNLDTMPLTKPEQFGTPVSTTASSSQAESNAGNGQKSVNKGTPKIGGNKRKRNNSSSVDVRFSRNRRSHYTESSDSELDESESTPKPSRAKLVKSASKTGSNSPAPPENGFKPVKVRQRDFGKVVCVMEQQESNLNWGPNDEEGKRGANEEGKRGTSVGDAGGWYPALVAKAEKRMKPSEVYVRSFRDNKFGVVQKSQLRQFEVSKAKKLVESIIDKSASPTANSQLKTAIDKATKFLEKDELPPNWDRSAILGEESSESESDASEQKGDGDAKKGDRDDENSEESSSEEESEGEDRDRFVAQFYKFQDERGTPINKAPVLGGQDLNLYKFYNVVQKQAGYNKVCNNGAWKEVLKRMKLDGCPGATTATVKNCYARYLLGFDTFYRQLGWRMDETWGSSRPARGSRCAQIKQQQQTRQSRSEKKEDKGGSPVSSEQRPNRSDSRNSAGSSVQGSTNAKRSQTPKLRSAPLGSATETGVVTRRSATPTTSAPKSDPVDVTQRKLPPPSEPAPKQTRPNSPRNPTVAGKKKSVGRVRAVSESEKSENGAWDSGVVPDKKEIEESSGSDTDEKLVDSQPESESKYFVGQKVRASYGVGAAKRWYDARILQMNGQGPTRRFFVHYLGWKHRYDEWIGLDRVRTLEAAPAASAPPAHFAKTAAPMAGRSSASSLSEGCNYEEPKIDTVADQKKTRSCTVQKESSVTKKLAEARKEKEEDETKVQKPTRVGRKSTANINDESSSSEEEEKEIGVQTRRSVRSRNESQATAPNKEDSSPLIGAAKKATTESRDSTMIGREQNGIVRASSDVERLREEAEPRPNSAPVIGGEKPEKKTAENKKKHGNAATPETEESPTEPDPDNERQEKRPMMENDMEMEDEETEEKVENNGEEEEEEEEEEMDIPQSEGGETPAYAEDEGWSRPSSIASPSTGRCSVARRKKKRKRNYSEMVTGKKSHKSTPKKESTDSDSEEGISRKDSAGSPRDNLAALKAKLQKEMEENPGAYAPRFNFTQMDPSWDSDKRISVMQQRLQEIREMYQKIKTNLYDMDRRWKQTQEKRMKKQEEEMRNQRLKAAEAEVIDILASSSSVVAAGQMTAKESLVAS